MKTLERKLAEEAGRATLRTATLSDGRAPKADTTVGVELDWLRDVRISLISMNPDCDLCHVSHHLRSRPVEGCNFAHMAIMRHARMPNAIS